MKTKSVIKRDASISLKLSKELRYNVEQIAKKERRTLSNMVEVIIEQYIKELSNEKAST